MKIIFLGPPGCGKGTQSKFLTKKYNIPQISTGDILRNITLKKTKLGIKIKHNLDHGILIQDDIIITLIKERIQNKDCSHGYILDGFPRTVQQAEEMEKKNIFIDYIIEFIIDEKNIYQRLLGRRIHPQSGRTYHIKFNPPKNPEKDDITNEKLIKRSDDNIKIIKKRLSDYNKIKNDIINFYRLKIKNQIITYYKINANDSIYNIQTKMQKIFQKNKMIHIN